jgi:hypothetical protein
MQIDKEVMASLVKTVNQKAKGKIDYDELKRLQQWALERFIYVSDEAQFKVSDMWSTEAYDKMMRDGILKEDCDGFSYFIIEALVKVFQLPKENLFRVSCSTETGEGHFVVWVKTHPEGIIYQVENRVRVPRSLVYMKELGYSYWHYSDMTRTDRWFNAEQRARDIIASTPSNLKSDKPIFSVKKAFAVHKSKTLTVGWVQIVTGFVTTMLPWLQSNEGYLERIISTESVGILMILLGFMAVFLRTITSKDIDQKADHVAIYRS